MDGILLIHKEANMTSHDVVFKLRKLLHIKKIGHAGTLDPNATGVLVVLVGKASKVAPYLSGCDKEYVAQLQLGQATFTQDIWGEVLEEKEVKPIQDFNALLQSFVGKQKQLPPMISSIKINGKKLYEYAREGKEVTRVARDIEIKEIECLDEANKEFRVVCTSGTYIRTLCVDIASKSNNLGCMKSLVRTKVGLFNLEDTYSLADVEAGNFKLHSIYDALSNMKKIEIEQMDDIINGRKIHLDCSEDEVCLVKNKEAFAIYKRLQEQENVFFCARGLW
ncbi:MAG: tRNA pseudouridine(55) synthase TruB [Erysipelotrichaceae bacterium]